MLIDELNGMCICLFRDSVAVKKNIRQGLSEYNLFGGVAIVGE
jgi:hypothetical protein